MQLLISIVGALTAILVSVVGAWMSNRNNLTVQARKLKEDHYIRFIEALHNLASDNLDKNYLREYTFARDKMFIVADETVVKAMLSFEENIRDPENHNKNLTVLIKAIRADLKLADRDFPEIELRKANK